MVQYSGNTTNKAFSLKYHKCCKSTNSDLSQPTSPHHQTQHPGRSRHNKKEGKTISEDLIQTIRHGNSDNLKPKHDINSWLGHKTIAAPPMKPPTVIKRSTMTPTTNKSAHNIAPTLKSNHGSPKCSSGTVSSRQDSPGA